MAEHDLELAAKFGLPEWGGFAAKIEAKYRAAWRTRGEAFVEAVADGAGTEPAELGERLLESETAADVFRLGLNRAAEVSDEEYIGALGRAVAGALDDAQVDANSYVVREISKLEPSQLRVFLACFNYGLDADHEPGDEDSPHLYDEVFNGEVSPIDANVARAWRVSAQEVTERVTMNGDLSFAALEQLNASGFVQKLSMGDVRPWEYHVQPSGLGARALTLMFPSIEAVSMGYEPR